ncbi:putative lipoprotein [Hyphomonas adhaerens MHS-3]|uniref:Putative lipoprotein n=1 Tax=Hyphomonas adhaerens MHS-3 TaxID=1280949 RepID=A0A069E2Y3_9PROT|nr:hypothetical protein [Hyphomonas adhaerens]KCZ84288.1 putative lipoprotein [Hyphomonas adhaerens MHS-3]
MMRVFFLSLSLLTAGPAAVADPGCVPGQDEKKCMIQAIWEAAAGFPADKRDRLKPIFLNTVALSGDAALLADWEGRLGGEAAPEPEYPDYVRERAEAELREADWNHFLQQAQAGLPPFNIGRPELMAAGARLAPDVATRQRVIEAMFALAGPPQPGARPLENFERGDFGHVLSELAMENCNLAAFDRAVQLTVEPDGLRYAFWRARITGGAAALAARVRTESDRQDTRHVREALEGYGAILQRGYCPA